MILSRSPASEIPAISSRDFIAICSAIFLVLITASIKSDIFIYASISCIRFLKVCYFLFLPHYSYFFYRRLIFSLDFYQREPVSAVRASRHFLDRLRRQAQLALPAAIGQSRAVNRAHQLFWF